MIEIIIIISSIVGSFIAGSVVARVFKTQVNNITTAIRYLFKKRYVRKRLKSGILKRDFGKVNNAVRLCKNLDMKYDTNNTDTAFRLYNLNEEIIICEKKFNEFYKVSAYDRLNKQELKDILEKYCAENSVSIVENDKLSDILTPEQIKDFNLTPETEQRLSVNMKAPIPYVLTPRGSIDYDDKEIRDFVIDNFEGEEGETTLENNEGELVIEEKTNEEKTNEEKTIEV